MPTAIVTGASRGLGLALGRALVERGWRLVVDARGAEALERELAGLPGVTAVAGDLADVAHRRALVPPPAARSTSSSTTRACSARARSPRSPTTRSTSCAACTRSTSFAPLALVQTALPQLAPRRAHPQRHLRRRRRAVRGLGRLRLLQGGAGPADARSSPPSSPDLRVYAVDPGDMRTQMHQEAFPGEDISDRPLPEESVPGPARADRRRPAERPLPGPRARGSGSVSAALAFELPERLEAHEPPEARGLGRDDVRLMVASAHDGRIVHARFRDLPEFLEPGDLLVVNTSATLPAALPAQPRPTAPRSSCGCRRRRAAARATPGGSSSCAARTARRPAGACSAGERFELPGGASAEVVAARAVRLRGGRRLWVARLDLPEPLDALPRPTTGARSATATSRASGRSRATRRVFALEPGSAEMASAGRPFTPELVTALVARGVLVAPLDAAHRRLLARARRGAVPGALPRPAATARLVNAVHVWGGRVIAVGTTVVRALETVAEPDGDGRRGRGLDEPRGHARARPVRGRRPAHRLARARGVAPARCCAPRRAADLLERSYRAALEHGYLWHEFGDSHLLLP